MNPKRTVVTILGIILSMALMLGCGLLASSFIESMKEETIERSGTYHVRIDALDPKNAQQIAQHLEVDQSYFYTSLGFAPFLDTQNNSKPYYHLVAANKELLEKQNLLEGRLPENSEEVVVSDHIRSNGGKTIEVGEFITLNVGDRVIDEEVITTNMQYVETEETFLPREEKKYKVVGIVKRSYIESYSAAGYTIFTFTDHYDVKSRNFLFLETSKSDGFVILTTLRSFIIPLFISKS